MVFNGYRLTKKEVFFLHAVSSKTEFGKLSGVNSLDPFDPGHAGSITIALKRLHQMSQPLPMVTFKSSDKLSLQNEAYFYSTCVCPLCGTCRKRRGACPTTTTSKVWSLSRNPVLIRHSRIHQFQLWSCPTSSVVQSCAIHR